MLDTGNVKSLIKANKIPDCSIIQQDNIISLNLDKIDGCEFYLISESPASFSKSTLSLELIESENEEKKYTVECDTEKNDIKIIKCKINDNINSDCSFKENIITESNKLITISSEEDKFRLLCEVNKTNNNKKKIIFIIIICSFLIIIAIIVIIIIICLKKGKKIKTSSISIPTKTLADKNNIITTSIKFDNKHNEEKEKTEDKLNVNDNKKIKKRKKKKKNKNWKLL